MSTSCIKIRKCCEGGLSFRNLSEKPTKNSSVCRNGLSVRSEWFEKVNTTLVTTLYNHDEQKSLSEFITLCILKEEVLQYTHQLHQRLFSGPTQISNEIFFSFTWLVFKALEQIQLHAALGTRADRIASRSTFSEFIPNFTPPPGNLLFFLFIIFFFPLLFSPRVRAECFHIKLHSEFWVRDGVAVFTVHTGEKTSELLTHA